MPDTPTPDLIAQARRLAEHMERGHMGSRSTGDLLTALTDRLEANTAEMLDLQRRLGEADENHAQAEARAAALADLEPVRELAALLDERPGWTLQAGGGRAALCPGTSRGGPVAHSGRLPHTKTAAALAALAGVMEKGGAG